MIRIKSRIKTFALYALVLAAGLGAGFVLSQLPKVLKKNYTEGDFSAYYPDARLQVVVYGTDWCGYCKKTREYLVQNHIKFSDLDIEKSPAAKQAHAQLGGGGVPLILVGNRRIQGFNASELDAAIKKLAKS